MKSNLIHFIYNRKMKIVIPIYFSYLVPLVLLNSTGSYKKYEIFNIK